MKILMINFDENYNKNDGQENDSKNIISRGCFCGCDWHGCDCEYNCSSDDDCTSDTDR